MDALNTTTTHSPTGTQSFDCQPQSQAQNTAEKTHAAFMHTDHDIVYHSQHTNGQSTTTTVRFDPPETVDLSSDSDTPFPSRLAMRKAELERRNTESSKADRGYQKSKEKHTAYSDIERQNFTYTVETSWSLFPGREATNFRVEYLKNSAMNGKTYYDSKGNKRVVTGAVTASRDRSTDKIALGRAVIDIDRHESVFYSGRPDSLPKAIEQAYMIFEKEEKLAQKSGQSQKGLTQLKDGTYVMTYVVNSFTKPGCIQSPSGYDERAGLIRERKALQELRDSGVFLINGKRVRFNPIHIHHNINMMDEYKKAMHGGLSGQPLVRKINHDGYTALHNAVNKHVDDSNTRKFVKTAHETLYGESKDQLKAEEKLMLTDMVARDARLPIVNHCKSNVDRTSVGATISSLNHEKYVENIPVRDEEAPHEMIKDKRHKKLGLAHMNAQHQVDRAARTGETSEGVFIGDESLELKLSGIPAAANILPEAATKKHHIWGNRFKVVMLTIGTAAAQILFGGPLAPLYQLVVSVISLFLVIKHGKTAHSLIKGMHMLPYQIKFWQIPRIGFRHKIDSNSLLINGDGQKFDDRHIARGGKIQDTNYVRRSGPEHQIVESAIDLL